MVVKRENATSSPETRASVPPHLAQSIKDKMRARGTPLREWDVEIDYCVKRGYDSAFIVDSETSETPCEDMKYLCAVLNSPLIRWYIEQIAPASTSCWGRTSCRQSERSRRLWPSASAWMTGRARPWEHSGWSAGPSSSTSRGTSLSG